MEELYCARPTLQTPGTARAAHLSTAPLALLSAVARCTNALDVRFAAGALRVHFILVVGCSCAQTHADAKLRF